MKLILENWRKFLNEAKLPRGASMINIDPQRYMDWDVSAMDLGSLTLHILFDKDKFLAAFEEEPARPEAFKEYFYSGIQTSKGCKTADGMGFQTAGTAAAPGLGWTAYMTAAAARSPHPIMPHRDTEKGTTPAAAKVWDEFIKRGATKVELDPSCPKNKLSGLDFALKISTSDWQNPPDVTEELSKEQIEALIDAYLDMFKDRRK